MKLIQREDLDKLLDFDYIFKKSKEGFAAFSNGQTVTPPFTVFEIPESGGSIHFKTGYVRGEKYFAWKYSGAFYGNEKLGLSNFLGLFLVFNSQTGQVEAVINDKGHLTDYRTGVAGAIATTTLARKNSETVAVIGTGVQARLQIKFLMKVMPFKSLNVFGRTKTEVEKYCSEIQNEFPKLKVNVCETVKETVQNADIIYTVTYSKESLIKSEWIKDGTHITAVGACEPSMQELDSAILQRASIVAVDSIEMTAKNGELHHALEKGLIAKDKAIELGTIISNNIKRREKDITVCDLVGLGFQDAVIGAAVCERALEKKLERNN